LIWSKSCCLSAIWSACVEAEALPRNTLQRRAKKAVPPSLNSSSSPTAQPFPAVLIWTAEKNDIAALSELAIESFCDAFGHSFSASDLASHLKKNLAPSNFSRILNEDTVLVAEEENRLIGYVQFGATSSCSNAGPDNDRELRRLYVHRDYQNAGLGKLLMHAALSHPRLMDARNIYLNVWINNNGAQRFYRRLGFEVIGTRVFEVESGAETSLDLIMVRRSSPGP
jgi:ribosomal protein S18 acetylase RimI-like enzyme